jgi:2-beta-glucuronyltransferase
LNVFFVSGHDASAGRKVDFHFWAESLEKKGCHVDFMTVGLSRATQFKKNHRLFTAPYNTWIALTPAIDKFVWRPLFHPFSLNKPVLDALTAPLFSLYAKLLPEAVTARVKQADIIIVESGVGLTLVEAFRKLAPNARLIYTVSDLLETLTFHPMVQVAERAALAHFESIRVPAAVMRDSFPAAAPIRYIPPGLDTSIFDVPTPSPFSTPKNAISVGDMLFNPDVIERLATHFPDWTFHVFGKKARLPQPIANVIEYGEQPFDTLVSYLQHADIGIAPYHDAPSVGYISQSSLKMVQYTYCQLPIVAPHFAAAGRPHVLSFSPQADAESLCNAFEQAISFDRASIDRSQVLNWDQVTDEIFMPGRPAAPGKSTHVRES